MAEICRFQMDSIDTVRSLISDVSNFIQDRLVNKDKRTQDKEKYARRLDVDDGSSENWYSDQDVLSNLEWASVALEEEINTSNMETNMAMLDYVEKMLNVCAMLNSSQRTAGVPNSHLSAWAHLNLSSLWKLRNDVHNAVLHILEMFIVEPYFSRKDFAPHLWKTLFFPHMGLIVRSYSGERERTLVDVIHDSSDLSSNEDMYFDDSLILCKSPDQAAKLQDIEQIYEQLLDENTRLYAQHYRNCLRDDSATTKKLMLMLPTAEPPINHLQKMTQKVPDYGRFGPILPNGGGFLPALKPQANANQESRFYLKVASSENPKHYSFRYPNNEMAEESEDKSENEGSHLRHIYRKNACTLSSCRSTVNMDVEATSNVKAMCVQNQSQKATIFSPMDSPKVLSNKDSSLKEHKRFRKTTTLPKTLYAQGQDSAASASISCNSTSYPHADIRHSGTHTEAVKQQKTVKEGVHPVQSIKDISDKSISSVSNEGNQNSIALPQSNKATPQSRLPRDFICPITGQIFSDPVTLETGQTYERRAIQEWICRGNTCPITRQPLSVVELPKTNHILKRLITNWEKQHPDLAKELSYDVISQSSISTTASQGISAQSAPSQMPISPTYWRLDSDYGRKPRIFLQDVLSESPTSLLYQPANQIVIKGLKPSISCLCNSEDLQECEAAVLKIGAVWSDSNVQASIQSYLCSPKILNGFIKILSASLKQEVLRTTIRILSQLIYTDDSGIEILGVDSNLVRLATLLKDGLPDVAVIIYLLRLSFSQLLAHDLIPSLTRMISGKSKESIDQFPIEPKDAALALLEQIIIEGDEKTRSLTANNIISAGAVPALLKCLDRVNMRQSIVEILLCCIHKSKSSRSLIAHRIEFSPVLELFHAGTDNARATCIKLFSELVRLSRRTSCNRILQRIKDEGAFSIMHTLLVHLHMAPVEQKPAIASLLLQLDLLVEPREISVYREEAIETLIEALHNKKFPASQMAALNALLSLPGHFDAQGKSCLEGWLLNIAGFNQSSNISVKREKQKTCGSDLTQTVTEEENVASLWGKKAAFVLCNHEKGMIFRVLAECIKCYSVEMTRSCIVMGTWLVHMLYDSPDIGTRDIALKSLLHRFIDILQSSKSVKDKILATLALRGFLSDPGTGNKLGACAKQIYKTLRKLNLNSVVANDLFKALIKLPSIDATELWSYDEGPELDATMNGEVLSMVHVWGRLISSHSDGTIKMWDAGNKVPHLVQEAREHTRAVTSLCLSSSGHKLFSGSFDKTIRVWVLRNEEMYCIEVHDVKESVVSLSANDNAAAFLTKGTGVKVYYWTGVPKQVSLSKTVKCIDLVGDKLYCGCTNYSIQEVDITTLKSTVFYTGARKWRGKQTVNSLASQNGILLAGGSCVDGIAAKVFSLHSTQVKQSLSTGHDILKLLVNKYFTFAATKVGVIVWLKERTTRLAYIRSSGMYRSKVTSLASDAHGQMLFTGSSHGKIQVFFTN